MLTLWVVLVWIIIAILFLSGIFLLKSFINTLKRSREIKLNILKIEEKITDLNLKLIEHKMKLISLKDNIK